MKARDGMSIFRPGPEMASGQEIASLESGLACLDDSLANQSAAEECDINTIVKRFGLTGRMPESIRLPTYADFGEEIWDYRSALERVRDAEKEFMKVPADIRAKFDNDPQRFLEFVSDEKNIDELRKLGLAKAKPAESIPATPPA